MVWVFERLNLKIGVSVSLHSVSFEGSLGYSLAGKIDLPKGDIRCWAIFAHCFTGSKDYFASSRISKALAEQGIAVLRFDFTGLGESEGAFHETNFSSNVNDMIKAADFLSKTKEPPRMLIGHSLGGVSVLFAASKIPSIKAVATLNAPCDPQHVQHHFAHLIPKMQREGSVDVKIGGRFFKVTKQFITDLNKQQTSQALKNFHAALLVCHTPIDQIVGIEQAAYIFEQAKHPKSFLSLDKADHLLTNPTDCAYVSRVISIWSEKYIGA